MFKDIDLTERVICRAYNVHNTPGTGFPEKVQDNALHIELEAAGLKVEQQRPISVLYQDQTVGEYFADLIVEGRMILELKALEKLSDFREIQLKNYLKG